MQECNKGEMHVMPIVDQNSCRASSAFDCLSAPHTPFARLIIRPLGRTPASPA